jgi:hypothetical protein
MNCEGGGNSAHRLASVGIARDLAPADLNAVRTGIGGELRKLYSDVLREEIPDRIAELIERLDQLMEATCAFGALDRPLKIDF